MKNHRNSTMVFLTILMLILSSIVTVTTSKEYGLLNTPEIFIEKTVSNGTAWAEYAEISLGEIVKFKGEVSNPNDYEINFSGIIYDEFPDNLRYVNESCTLLDFSPDVYEEVDWENNNVTWHRIPILPPGETFTFYYNATAVDCGLRINNIYTQAYVVYFGEEKIPVFDSDDATVNVICYDEPEICIEKMVWNGDAWAEYAEVSLGDTVQFRVEIYNPNDEYIIHFSGYIYDLFPDNLRYDEGSLIVLREDNVWNEIVDWEKNMVNWSAMEEIYPGDYLNFTFNATAVDCGLGVNNLFVVASMLYTNDGEIVIDLTGSDEATVYVDCDPCEEADITVEKYVKWDCSTDFVKYVDAEIGDYVIFKLIVNNTGETPLDIVVVDEIPTGLSYGGNANPEPDVINENIITWYFNNVDPETSIVITFRADVDECGEQINLVNVTGTFENQIVYDEDTATVNVTCPDEPGICVIKSVKKYNSGEYSNYVSIDLGCYAKFRINVTNTGDLPLDIIVKDKLPSGLEYNNSATPWEPEFIDGNYTWYFEDVAPQETITITFKVRGIELGEQTNFVNVTGITEQEEVFDEDTATVEVICDGEWDKSSIQVTGECISPDAVFTITNTGKPGEGDMAGPSEYRVYRNDILEETNTFQLAGGESLIVTVLADCDTIRLEADQRPGHPGSSQPQETIEDCGCVDSELEIGIEEAFFIGKLRAFVKNNKEIDISDVNWDITVKSTGLFKKINSITEDIIELLESDEKKTLKTKMIRGLGKVEVVFKATAPDMEPATITKIGFVIGRIIILFPPK